jgi:deoxyadenosine/deoxycytidine kinase
VDKQLVVVSGNLGTGKTTLVQRVGQNLNWHTVYESVEDNPYLEDFYNDMRTWSFHLQIYFLGHRAKQQLEVVAAYNSVIMDRSVYEDANVFARALHSLGNITDRDYENYLRVFNLVVGILPPPDLLIYLKAPIEVLIKRMHHRGLGFDYEGIGAEYLTLIESYYEAWIPTFDLCPVITINTNNFDYVNDEGNLEIIIKRILLSLQDKKGGKK